jgi:putative aldouronate transport system permease protein
LVATPAVPPTLSPAVRPTRWQRVLRNLQSQWILYLMILPGVIYFLVFRYYPMWGASIAFKDFSASGGINGSPWAGFTYFERVFESTYFTNILTNTLIISAAKFFWGIPVGIGLALMINEVRFSFFKKTVQTITYLPHFLSWIVVYGVLIVMLSPGEGLLNKPIRATGNDPIAFLASPDWFRTVVVASSLWKEAGWSAIIYLAALASISPELYEAASVDGASRLRRIRDISIPGILPVVMLVSLLNLGSILNAGFEQILVMYSPATYSVGDIIDTWVYRNSILGFQFSVGAAVGLFKGVIGLVLIVFCNWLARRLTGKGVIW